MSASSARATAISRCDEGFQKRGTRCAVPEPADRVIGRTDAFPTPIEPVRCQAPNQLADMTAAACLTTELYRLVHRDRDTLGRMTCRRMPVCQGDNAQAAALNALLTACQAGANNVVVTTPKRPTA